MRLELETSVAHHTRLVQATLRAPGEMLSKASETSEALISSNMDVSYFLTATSSSEVSKTDIARIRLQVGFQITLCLSASLH